MLSLPLVTFGLRQLAETTLAQLDGPAALVDLLAYYSGSYLILHDPSHLYDVETLRSLERTLQGGRDTFMRYWSPPNVALLLAPLALLPFGQAYLLWLIVNVVSLAASAYLLAPRPFGPGTWVLWVAAAPLLVPIQMGLIMGQMPFIMLLGFSLFVRTTTRPPSWWSGLLLLPWSLKPHFLPAILGSLWLGGRGPAAAALAFAAAAAAVIAIGIAGPSSLVQFLTVSSQISGHALAGTDGPGQNVFGLAQTLAGTGPVALAASIVGAFGIYGLVAYLWRSGLRPGPARHLQLAALPLAATLAAPHTLIYEVVTWLASAWLLLTFTHQTGRGKPLVYPLLLAGWAASNVAVVTERSGSPPWAGLVGLAALGAIAYLFTTERPSPARQE